MIDEILILGRERGVSHAPSLPETVFEWPGHRDCRTFRWQFGSQAARATWFMRVSYSMGGIASGFVRGSDPTEG